MSPHADGAAKQFFSQQVFRPRTGNFSVIQRQVYLVRLRLEGETDLISHNHAVFRGKGLFPVESPHALPTADGKKFTAVYRLVAFLETEVHIVLCFVDI